MHRSVLFLSCLVSTFFLAPASSADGFERIEFSVGDITLLIREESQWTPGRIDFRGKPMTTERSAYGTVFSFPGTGFIGTGHLENEPEEINRLHFTLDGKTVEPSSGQLSGSSFRFERDSHVRTLELESVIELTNNRLYETATVRAREATPLKLLYHFMHAWVPTASQFLAGSDSDPGKTLSGSLTDSEETARKFYIQDSVDWIAVYDPASEQFGVSRLIVAPTDAGNISMIWNVPQTYRKYYLKCFQNDTIPAGFEGTWKMVTAFGESDLTDWKSKAVQLAADLK